MLWLLAVTTALAACGDTTACTCSSLFSLTLAERYGLDSCDADAAIPCDSDLDGNHDDLCTADEFLQLVYDEPFKQKLVDQTLPKKHANGTDGELYALTVPMCQDGSDDCAAGSRLRCVDGTRPLFWIDPPDDVDPLVAPTEPRRWIFTFQGGGACGAVDGLTPGASCRWAYTEGDKRPQMTGWELVDDAGDGSRVGPDLVVEEGGVFEPDLDGFRDAYRVKVGKCSFDRMDGAVALTEWEPDDCGTGDCDFHQLHDISGGLPVDEDGNAFRLQFTGRRQIEAILSTLAAGGLQVRDWSTQGNPVVATLPPLAGADQIVFAGHSGGAGGLQHNLDGLAEHVYGFAPEVDVRGVFDARGWPGFNHTEAMHHGTNPYQENAFGGGLHSGANHLPLSPDTPDEGRTTSSATFEPGGEVFTAAQLWGLAPDQSCLGTVEPLEAWRCQDGMHVMFNHTSTPFFLRQSLQDEKHTPQATGATSRDVPYADDPAYRWGNDDYRERVIDQLQAFVDERDHLRHREAVYGWTEPDDIGIGAFLPETPYHEGLFSTPRFNGDDVVGCDGSERSYASALWQWLTVGGDQIFVDQAFFCPSP